MSISGKKASKKKVLKIVLISLAIFIVLNLIGAAVGTSTSITHPSLESYENRIASVKEKGLWGDFDSYDKQDYQVSGLDGYQLSCTFVSSKETRGTGKYVIISHGHKSNKYAMVKFVDPYIQLGFSCIIYDQRGHGANAKASCSMGGWEAQDLDYLIKDTYSRYKDVDILGLHGESMGSSTSLNVLRYTDKVSFIVADCGMESLKYMVHDMYNDMYLYPFGTCADIGFKLLYNIDTSAVSGIEALKGRKVPILFVHGADDDWIDVDNSKDMYDAAVKEGIYSELWLVPGAKHGESVKVAGQKAYSEHISSFLHNAGVVRTEEHADAA
ncbi:MAG: alpha/beta hydrolase [Saccharofermentans sp.]|nr:alpha/beta hydrolase [Saccharofermentans sp.]